MMENSNKKEVAILGSTGSVGSQALEVIEEHSEHFRVSVLTAGRNAGLLIKQARKFKPRAVVISDDSCYLEVNNALSGTGIQVHGGADALCGVVEMPEIDIVLAAMTGFAGLRPVLAAVNAGKEIALANKEPLVVAGGLVMDLARKRHTKILPVDSEHSAIFQCLAGESQKDIEKIFITASGGPFRKKDLSYLRKATPEDALNHPNWSMGKKITIDSASLMNKGLEVIEAKWLFDLRPDQIEVLIHPQSIIHSMVQFNDGSVKAQLATADMRLPIQYAFGYPGRTPNSFPKLNFKLLRELNFHQPDMKTFRNLALAYQALEYGGVMPCVLNAANEVVVEAFLNRRISFPMMSNVIEMIMSKAGQINDPNFEDLVNVDMECRQLTMEAVSKLSRSMLM